MWGINIGIKLLAGATFIMEGKKCWWLIAKKNRINIMIDSFIEGKNLLVKTYSIEINFI